MRVFVAGATGAIGVHLMPRLVAAEHAVVGMTHSSEKADMLRRMGAEPAIADGLEPGAVRAAVAAARPDVIVHEMTALRGLDDLRRFDRTFSLTNRLRTEGLDNLLSAARAAGTRRIVVQSYCGWPYARTGGAVKSEDDPLDPDPAAEQRRSFEAIRYLETTTTATPNIEGIVLRYGAFYGRATGMLDHSVIAALRRRRFPMIGNGSAWWSFIRVEDAAAATAAAVERGAPGIYNIVDDEPAPVREWLPALAALVGAKRPLRIPVFLARFFAGEHLVRMMTEARAGSNAKAKRELGWQPVYASWRQGFAAALSGHNLP
jgi:nucleoside-diphosphate-sugar epimerase